MFQFQLNKYKKLETRGKEAFSNILVSSKLFFGNTF